MFNKIINNIITLTRNICNKNICRNYFKFKEKYYKQEEGLPMGSPVSAIMSEIYLQDFEEKIITGITHTQHIKLDKYVDDTLVIYNPIIQNEHLIILNKLHTYNKNLRFTYE